MAKKVKQIISKHDLIPKHIILSTTEKDKLLKQYSFSSLPKIGLEDPAVVNLNAKVGDVIKIERKSQIIGKSVYYRGVINV